MKFRVEVICLHDDGEQRCSVMEMERAELAMDTLGLSMAEGKMMLRGVQDFVTSQPAREDLKRRRNCPSCSHPHHSKDAGTHKHGVRSSGSAESPVASVRLSE